MRWTPELGERGEPNWRDGDERARVFASRDRPVTEFTPVSATLGGLLIGVAAAGLLLVNGRIAGVSGFLGYSLSPGAAGERPWRIAFLLGLPLGVLAYGAVAGAPSITIAKAPVLLVVAGLLVGFGTQVGSGCTSGHGVCGLARLSLRSLVATGTFMATAALVVFARRTLLGGW
jgi:uncharacterized membrane protein YedE/YeeE